MNKILLLAGDGIGPEIMAQTQRVITLVNERFNMGLECESALIGGAAIEDGGEPLPDSTLNLAKAADAVLLGAVGGPKWDDIALDKRPEKALLKIRRELGLFANLRPAMMFPELVHASSLKPEYVENLDMLTVRELTGGIYYGEPRGHYQTPVRKSMNTMVYSEEEIRRVAIVAFDLAMNRRKRVCSVDKANVLEVSQLWREVVSEVAKDYPKIELCHMYVDNAAMQLVKDPKQFDVLVMGNLFGDIISDCSAMLTGSIGMLPSASLNQYNKGLFEPVHGSAPDIAGKNCVNPCAMVLSFAMLCEYSFGQKPVAHAIHRALSQVLASGQVTADIAKGQAVSTTVMGDAIIQTLKELTS